MKNFKGFYSTGSAAVAIGRITPSGKALTGLLTLTLAFAISGCSHSRKQTANSNHNSSAQNETSQTVAPSVPVGQAPVANQPEIAKKKSVKSPVKRLSATRTYKDEVSGLSFTYPRRSMLEVGDKADQDVIVATQLPMNFAQPGGATMAVVELPGIAKSGSDFTPAFFAISVNKQLTADQCSQFAPEKAEKSNTDSAGNSTPSSTISKLTVGGVEYTELDKQTENGAVKYYHRFIPGATAEDNGCYEFAMSVKSAEQKQDGEKMASLDLEHKNAFTRLEKILASVNIRSEKKSETVEAVKTMGADSEAAKTDSSKLEASDPAAKINQDPR